MFQIFKPKDKTRHLIFHYHLFKNAGSTFDSILRKNFRFRWGSIERDPSTGNVTDENLMKYIVENPKLIAISSHEARPPAPIIPGLKIYSILFLRHPIDRIGSVYSYRRSLRKIITKSTQIAKDSNMAEYIKWCLKNPREESIVNFHVYYLSKIGIDPSPIPSIDLALQTLQEVSFFGIVEFFDDSLLRLKNCLAKPFGRLEIKYKIKNKSLDRMSTIEERLRNIELTLGRDLYQEILERNAMDLELYRIGLEMFTEMKKNKN